MPYLKRSTSPKLGLCRAKIPSAKFVITNKVVAEEVLALKQQPGKDICVGSLSIASRLSERGLIDEYQFVVHPIVAGKGPRLFETVKPQDSLRLDFIGSKTFRSGVVALHYRKHT